MKIVLRNGKILLKNGKIATANTALEACGCCCSAALCPEDLRWSIEPLGSFDITVHYVILGSTLDGSGPLNTTLFENVKFGEGENGYGGATIIQKSGLDGGVGGSGNIVVNRPDLLYNSGNPSAVVTTTVPIAQGHVNLDCSVIVRYQITSSVPKTEPFAIALSVSAAKGKNPLGNPLRTVLTYAIGQNNITTYSLDYYQRVFLKGLCY